MDNEQYNPANEVEETALETEQSEENQTKDEEQRIPIGMIMGIALGMVFGMLLFDEPGKGLALGMCFGLSFGVAIDALRRSRKK